ncbi:MAG: carotenoid oxygenase family protein [Gammaproteobacteria bacterium]|nr:carotenoid oxygenase family protein [Gammaproteobacteria bacterium]
MAEPYPEQPFLTGNFAPLRMECDLQDVIVRGEIPRDLDITYYRNGPDPQFAPRGEHHWFAGDGMLHMFQVQNGRVQYRNRWVRTAKWKLEHGERRALYNPFNPLDNDPLTEDAEDDGLANTNVVWHGGKLLALEEGHPPFEIDPQTLESKGAWRFNGQLEGPMTAHPKMDPTSGEMLFFGYMADGPFGKGMTYQTVNASGELTRSDKFQAPYASMVHDFITTDEHVIFPIFPLTGSLERAMNGQPAFAWEPDKGTHIGVMRRDGSIDDIRWFETDPCYVFHPMNAYTKGNKVVAHVMQFEQAPLFPHLDGSPPDPEKSSARLCEWVFDLADNSNGVQRRYLDDVTGEFPRLDERFVGLEYDYGYYGASTRSDDGVGFNAIARYDFKTGQRHQYELPEGDVTGEPVFVPKSPDSPEGEGYLMSIVYRARENRSDLAFFDAENLSDGPLALAELPHRVPFGFHGNWKYNA